MIFQKNLIIRLLLFFCITSLQAMEQERGREYNLFESKEFELTEKWKQRSSNKDVIGVFAELIDEEISNARLEEPRNLVDGVVQLNSLLRKRVNLNGTNSSFRANGLLVCGSEMPSHPVFKFWMTIALKRVLEENNKVKSLIDYVIQELAKKVTEDNKEDCAKLVTNYLPRMVSEHVDKEFANTYGWFDEKGLVKKKIQVYSKEILELLPIDSNRVAAVLSNNTVRIWNATTGICDKKFIDFKYLPMIAAKGKKILIGDDEILKSPVSKFTVLSARTGQLLTSYEGAADGFMSFLFFDETKCISEGLYGIKVWDISCVDKPRLLKQIDGGSPFKLNKNTIVFLEKQKVLGIFDVFSENYLQVPTEHSITNLLRFDKEQFLSCSQNGIIQLWNIQGDCLQTFKGHERDISQMIRINNTTFASCSIDRTIKIWDIRSGMCKLTIKGFNPVIKMRLLNTHFLVVASLGLPASGLPEDQNVKILDINNGKCLRTFTGFEEFLGDLAIVTNEILYCNGNKLRIISKPTLEQTINFLANKANKELIPREEAKKESSCLIC